MGRSDLPTGTVTFLFSDIEGSTKLLQRLGAGFEEVLDRHNEIVRGQLAAHNGVEVSTEGDSFFGAFSSAADAVTAAGEIQHALASTDWPAGGVVKVRIGMHTGVGELGGDNYIGLDVHRAARIGAAGHGGQVVVSAATRVLASGAEFIELGNHRLKDFDEPQPLFQLLVDDLPESYPPLRTLDARPNNLPTVATALVGREEEREELLARLDRSRLVTVVGLGGVGKTRLAIDVAAAALPGFDEGVCFVDLAPVVDPTLVMGAIAAELRIEATEPAAIAEALRPGERLVVLDNLERLTEVAPQLSELLQACASLTLLVTSQVPLRISGEDVYRLEPLARTDGDGTSPAVALFASRAAAADPGFDLAAHAHDVAALVQALGGLPLGIELAAARVNVLDPAEILERLQSTDAVLSARKVDAPERHRSLENAIAWSYDLLTASQQAVLRALSVFRGGATMKALEAVAAADVLDDLAELVDRGLVQASTATSKRFDVMDSVGGFAARQLTEDEAAMLAERHSAFFVEVGSSAEPGLVGDRAAWWQDSMGDDHENYQAVLGRLVDAGDAGRGFDLLAGSWRYYRAALRLGEAQLWLDRLFRLPGAVDPTPHRARGLIARGALHYWLGEFDPARADYAEAVEIAWATGDKKLMADSRFGLSTSLGQLGQIDEAAAMLDEAGELYEEINDAWALGHVAGTRAFYAAVAAGGPEAVEEPMTEALRQWEDGGFFYEAAGLLGVVAWISIHRGDIATAKRQIVRSIDLAEEARDRMTMAQGLLAMAIALAAAGDSETSAILTGAWREARQRMGGGFSVATMSPLIDMPDPAASAIEALGADRAEELFARGSELSLDDALEIVREV